MHSQTKAYNRNIRTRKFTNVTLGRALGISAATQPEFHLGFILFVVYSKLYADVSSFCGAYNTPGEVYYRDLQHTRIRFPSESRRMKNKP